MSDSYHIVCPSCGATNKVPADRLGDSPICGKCKAKVLPAEPISATDANFMSFLEKSTLPVVIDFWAPWCSPCLGFAPTYAEVAGEMVGKAIFLKIDTQANPEAGAAFRIMSIPTLMVMHQRKLVNKLSGAMPKPQFVQWLEQSFASIEA